eukprot:GILK01012528.1.p1 GENE.GILK01012528.1~~GILK01012528.1.p1  ORF type:complete len:1689 (-),score=369.17 GILK01012528.1:157-5121(-)
MEEFHETEENVQNALQELEPDEEGRISLQGIKKKFKIWLASGEKTTSPASSYAESAPSPSSFTYQGSTTFTPSPSRQSFSRPPTSGSPDVSRRRSRRMSRSSIDFSSSSKYTSGSSPSGYSSSPSTSPFAVNGASSFTEPQLQELHRAFDACCMSSEDAVKLSAVGNVLSEAGVDLSVDELVQLKRQIGGSDEDYVTFDQFCRGVKNTNLFIKFRVAFRKKTRGSTQHSSDAFRIAQTERLRRAFNAWDREHKGVISEGELKQVFRHLGRELKDEEAESLMSKVDTEHHGYINFEQFTKCVDLLQSFARHARDMSGEVLVATGMAEDTSWGLDQKDPLLRASHLLARCLDQPLINLAHRNMAADLRDVEAKIEHDFVFAPTDVEFSEDLSVLVEAVQKGTSAMQHAKEFCRFLVRSCREIWTYSEDRTTYFQAQVARLEQERIELKQKYKESEKNLRRLQTRCNEHLEKISQMEAQVKPSRASDAHEGEGAVTAPAMRAKLRDMNKQVEQLREEADDLQRRLQVVESEKEGLLKDRSNKEVQLLVVEAARDELADKLDLLQEENHRLKAELDSTLASVHRLPQVEAENHTLKQQLDSLRTELHALQAPQSSPALNRHIVGLSMESESLMEEMIKSPAALSTPQVKLTSSATRHSSSPSKIMSGFIRHEEISTSEMSHTVTHSSHTVIEPLQPTPTKSGALLFPPLSPGSVFSSSSADFAAELKVKHLVSLLSSVHARSVASRSSQVFVSLCLTSYRALRQRCMGLEAQLKEQTDAVTVLERQMAASYEAKMASGRQEMESQSTSVLQSLNQKDLECARLVEQIEEERMRRGDVESALEHTKLRMEELQQTLSKCTTAFAEASHQPPPQPLHVNQQSQSESSTVNVRGHEATPPGHESDLDASSDSIEEAHHDRLMSADSQTSFVSSRIKELESQVDELSSKLRAYDDLNDQFDMVNAEAEDLRAQVKALKGVEQTCKRVAADSREQQQTHEARVVEMERMFLEQESRLKRRIDSLQTELDRERNEKAAQARSASSTEEALRTTLSVLQQDHVQLGTQLEEIKRENSRLMDAHVANQASVQLPTSRSPSPRHRVAPADIAVSDALFYGSPRHTNETVPPRDTRAESDTDSVLVYSHENSVDLDHEQEATQWMEKEQSYIHEIESLKQELEVVESDLESTQLELKSLRQEHREVVGLTTPDRRPGSRSQFSPEHISLLQQVQQLTNELDEQRLAHLRSEESLQHRIEELTSKVSKIEKDSLESPRRRLPQDERPMDVASEHAKQKFNAPFLRALLLSFATKGRYRAWCRWRVDVYATREKELRRKMESLQSLGHSEGMQELIESLKNQITSTNQYVQELLEKNQFLQQQLLRHSSTRSLANIPSTMEGGDSDMNRTSSFGYVEDDAESIHELNVGVAPAADVTTQAAQLSGQLRNRLTGMSAPQTPPRRGPELFSPSPQRSMRSLIGAVGGSTPFPHTPNAPPSGTRGPSMHARCVSDVRDYANPNGSVLSYAQSEIDDLSNSLRDATVVNKRLEDWVRTLELLVRWIAEYLQDDDQIGDVTTFLDRRKPLRSPYQGGSVRHLFSPAASAAGSQAGRIAHEQDEEEEDGERGTAAEAPTHWMTRALRKGLMVASLCLMFYFLLGYLRLNFALAPVT